MKPNLDVLHVVGGYPTPSKPHFQMFIKTQIDSLVDFGIHCDVLTLQGRGPRKYLFGRSQLQKALSLRNYDLIHAHYSYCGWVGMGGNLPLVSSFLGSDLFGFPRADGSFPWWMKAFHVRLAQRVADRSEACIVKSKAMRDVLGRDAHVVPNGVNCDLFHELLPENRLSLRQDLGLKNDTFYILFAGNPELPRKRYSLAQASVDKAAESTSRPLVLIPLSGRSHQEVVQHMQACDMLILTSSLEGSPNVVKEAMAANMPVVSVDVGDTKERLEGVAGCRVSRDENPETIGQAIAEIVDSAEGCGARKAVLPLDMPLIAERISNIYSEVLGRN